MILAKNFTLEELTVTETGLPNIPDDNAMRSLLYLATYILQPIRDKWGALIVSSGYRSFEVNKKIGGALTSQHVLGEAADFIPLTGPIGYVFEWLVVESGIKFGQAISEEKAKNGEIKKWIHISLVRNFHKNNEALIFKNGAYSPYV